MPINRIDDDSAVLRDAQRGAEDALADYRGQIEAIDRSQMMIEFGMDGAIIRANENYLRAFGYTHADIDGKDHSIFVTEEFKRSKAYAEFWDELRRGVFQSGLFPRVGKGGREVWIEASYNPVLGPDGRPIKVIKFASDVTERIRMQDHLKDAEARLKATLDSVLDGIITIDAGGTIVSLNPAATRMFEYEESEIAGQNIKMLMPEPDRGAHDGYLARHQSTGKSKVIGVGRELEGLTRTGRTFPMELTVTEMALQGRKFFVGLVRDISERRLQEKALRKSEEFLDRSGRLAQIGGWELDLLTHEVSWSNETRLLHGFENDRVPTLEEGINFYAPEARPVIRAAVERAITEGKDWEVVVPVIRVDGTRIWARVTATVQFADGKPARLVGAFQDVTSRVIEQKALEEANARAVLAAESCGIGIWDWDLSGGKFACDAYIYRLFGLKPECEKRFDLEFWGGRVHREDRPAVEKGLQDCIAGIRPYDIEFRNVWDDGSIHYIKATGKVTRGPDGRAARMVGTNMEITAAKQAEEALHDQANLLDLSHDGIMVRKLDGVIRFWNDGAEEMYGYSKEQAEGRNCHELLRTEFPRPLAEIDAELSLHGRWEGELGHTTRDGEHIVVASRWVLQKVGNGAPNRVLEINSDITQRKRAEEESLRNIKALIRSNEELDHFAYAASHDLKAPLRVIHNAAKWLEEDLEPHLSGETRENMILLRGRVVRMERLLDDLLEYSRIGRKTEKGKADMLSADKLMGDVLELISPPGAFAVSVSSTLAGVHVKRMPLQQVLINLIGNAVKHHDRKSGRIEVSVEDLGTQLEFAVSDDGPGIPAQFHEQVFKMFQTLKPRDQVEGSGMGLAMVRKYVEVSGGAIRLESAQGQGSTFRFTWPKLEQIEGATE